MDVDLSLIYTPTRVINLANNGSNIFPFTSPLVPLVGDTVFIRFQEPSTNGAWDLYYELTAADLVSYPNVIGSKIVNLFLSAYGLTGTYSSNTITVIPSGGRSVSQISFLPGGTTKKLDVTGNFGGLIINSTPIPLKFREIMYLADGFSYRGKENTFTVSAADQPQSTFYVKSSFPVFNSQITNNNVLVRIKKNGSVVYTYTQVVPGSSSANIAFETPFFSGILGDEFSFEVLSNTGTVLTSNAPPTAFLSIWGRYEGNAVPGLKTNTTVKVGGVYYDQELRSTGVIPFGEINVPPFYLRGVSFSQEYNVSAPVLGFIPNFECKIKNLAPSFAKKYQILLSVVTYSYIQVLVKSQSKNADGTVTFVIDDFRGFEIDKSCRARLVGVNITGTNIGIVNEYLLTNDENSVSYWDVSILDVDLGDKSIILPANAITFASERSLVIEIYNPALSQNEVYYEIGEEYDVLKQGDIYYHQGLSQNQDPLNPVTVPAIVTVKKGDTWYRYRNAGNTVSSSTTITADIPPYFIESESISDFKESNFWDKGRINVETPNQHRQKYGQLMRWSGRLFPNTQVNNLSVWDEGNYNNQLNQRFGDITGLREVGYTLNILQWMNISKAFLGRQQLMNTDGSSNLVITDNLIGSINPSEQEYGTKHPGSVCVAGDFIYYLDTIKGKYLRSASNGVFPISDYFMQNYWRTKSAEIESNSNLEVISGFDFKYHDLYTTIRNPAIGDSGINLQETIYFNEAQNAWKYNVAMETISGTRQIIDWYAWVGQSFFTFMNARVWQQGVLTDDSGNPKYLNLFGEDKSLVIETIGMIEPDKVKIFLAHAIHANVPPTLVEFFIPPNTMFPNGMYSYLKPGNYEYKEGVFYAAIKKDWFTKGIPVDDAAGRLQIAEGRALIGHVVKVRLTYTTNEYVQIFSTGIEMIPSEKS